LAINRLWGGFDVALSGLLGLFALDASKASSQLWKWQTGPNNMDADALPLSCAIPGLPRRFLGFVLVAYQSSTTDATTTALHSGDKTGQRFARVLLITITL
jgi:hypothetical protein